MIDRHNSHVNVLRKLALQKFDGRVTGEPLGVIVVAVKDHGHQADLAQGIEVRPRTARADGLSALDQPERSDSLRFAVVQDTEIFGLQILYCAAFLIADNNVEQNLVGLHLNRIFRRNGSLKFLREDDWPQ